MNIKREDIDITAPVGCFDSLNAAIKAGADSVYFGIGKYNMRARSAINFSEKDLGKIVRICRHFNKKAYLALNIVFFDEEIQQMKRTMDMAKAAGIDAVIASDQAVLSYARTIGMQVHLSTQLNISNIETLKFYAGYADVAVLSRELSLEQIGEMTRQILNQDLKGPSGKHIRIEIFIHGALCMSISGKCYLSLHHYNQSANRGLCLQDCRRKYLVREMETGNELEVSNPYIMSPKDLCTIHFINKILEAGVRVLKIEGRARSPEYVNTVTECYDQAVRSYINGSYSPEKIANWQSRLSSVFNRGFWDGYYLGQKLGEWNHTYGSNAVHEKVYVARNMNYFSNLKIADFLCESDSLKVGDWIYIIGPTTGVIEQRIGEIQVDRKQVREVKKGERFSIMVPRKVRRSDKLYKVIEKKPFPSLKSFQ